MSDERPVVKHPDKMDDETFLKHMNARHSGAAGVSHFGRTNVPGDDGESLLRSMHRILHRDGYDPQHPPNHTHGESA